MTKSDLVGNNENSQESNPILDIHGIPIDPIWAAEFRGFFWGEGSLSSRVLTKDRNGLSAGIGLRTDDEIVLRQIKDRLGGSILVEPYRDGSGKTVSRWVVHRGRDLRRVVALLSPTSGLTFNKKRQLAVFKELVDIRLDTIWPESGGVRGRVPKFDESAQQRMQWLHDELRRLKQWDS